MAARKKNRKPVIIGLTGGIGAGKSTVAKMFARLGIPSHNADDAVHALLSKDGAAVKPIAKLFPTAIKRGAVDRQALGKIVFGDKKQLKKLEAILHPLVHKAERAVVEAAAKARAPGVVLDIPLLFETGAHRRCDYVVVVEAPLKQRKQRVMKRRGMTDAKFKAIVAQQMTEAQRRPFADFIIDTGKTAEETRRQVAMIANATLVEWWLA